MSKDKPPAKPVKPEKPAYQMPEIGLGRTVLWYDSLGAPPTAMAHVTAVGSDSVSLAVLGPGYHNFLVKEGVRHVDHPNKEMIRATDMGVWDYTEADKRLDRLLRLVEEYFETPATLPDEGSK
jgi:hypothetical protein